MDTSFLIPATGLDHDIRRTTVTGTDIGALLGVNPHKSKWDVYAHKTGLVDGKRAESEAMMLGTLLQLPVMHVYQEKTGNPVTWWDKTIIHPEDTWASCTTDGVLAQLRLDGKKGIYEGKTAGSAQVYRWGPSWSEEFPEEYRAQADWNCHVMGADFCDIAVLLGAESLQVRIYRTEPSPARLRELREVARQFWFDHVVPRVPPEITATSLAKEFLKGIPQNADFRAADENEIALIEEYLALKASVAPNTERLEDLKVQLQNACGENAGLLWDGGKVTYKPNAPSSVIDWEKVANEAATLIEWSSPDGYESLVKKHTTTKPGARPLVVRVGGGRKKK